MSVEEFTEAMTELGFERKKGDMKAIFDELDTDKSGTVSEWEFVQGVSRWMNKCAHHAEGTAAR